MSESQRKIPVTLVPGLLFSNRLIEAADEKLQDHPAGDHSAHVPHDAQVCLSASSVQEAPIFPNDLEIRASGVGDEGVYDSSSSPFGRSQIRMLLTT